MQPTDLALLRTLSDPNVHPDGQRVAFTVTRPDIDEDCYDGRVWLWDGTRATPFTQGPHDDRPRWSPDGSMLAFLRRDAGDGARAQLAVMPADGGEARVVTELPYGVTEAEWSPDGTRLAIAGGEWVDALAELDDDERRRRPRRVTHLPYRGDDHGYVADRRTNLHLVDPWTEQVTRLTDGDVHDGSIAWRPDGAAVAFVSARHATRGLDGENQPFEVDVVTGELTEVQPPGAWEWVGYDPDGRVLLVGLRRLADWPGTSSLWRVEDGVAVDLLPDLDRGVEAGAAPGPRRLHDGWLLVVEDRGTQRVVGLGDDGRVHDLAGDPDRVVTGTDAGPGVGVDGRGGLLVAVVTTGTDPGELVRVDDDATTTLTDCNATLRAEGGLRPVERFTFERDGVEIDAWAVLPEGEGPWPVLVNVHGGPTAQYTSAFFDEFQVYAAAGHLVVGANPRGSSGRGTAWARAVRAVWHTDDPVDLLDLRAVADAALDRYDRADPDRLGIMGGSYGGFATARIIGVDHRFRSAVVERALLAFESFGGTSDIGPFFDRLFLDATLPDDAGRLRAASPLWLAAHVTTPTLVVHAEHDWRCPIEQGEQYLVALLRAGVDAEMVRFPDEGHELSRSGSPRHRVERFEAILDWHARHL